MFPNAAPPTAAPPAKPAPTAMPPQQSSNPAEDQLARALGFPPGMKVPPETMKLACAGKFGPDVKQLADAADGGQAGGQPTDDSQGQDTQQTPPRMGASSIFGKPGAPAPAGDDDGDEQAQGPMSASKIFGRR